MEFEKPQAGVALIPAAIFYFVIFAIAIAVDYSKRIFLFPDYGQASVLLIATDAIYAVLLGLGVVALSLAMEKWIPAFKKLAKHFHGMLGSLTLVEIFFMAAFSSIAEELFFRGLLLHYMGLGLSSIVFGLLHMGPGKEFLPWTLFAVAMGFFLGAVYIWFGNIYLPIGIHFTVNFVNLIILQKKQKTAKP